MAGDQGGLAGREVEGCVVESSSVVGEGSYEEVCGGCDSLICRKVVQVVQLRGSW